MILCLLFMYVFVRAWSTAHLPFSTPSYPNKHKTQLHLNLARSVSAESENSGRNAACDRMIMPMPRTSPSKGFGRLGGIDDSTSGRIADKARQTAKWMDMRTVLTNLLSQVQYMPVLCRPWITSSCLYMKVPSHDLEKRSIRMRRKEVEDVTYGRGDSQFGMAKVDCSNPFLAQSWECVRSGEWSMKIPISHAVVHAAVKQKTEQHLPILLISRLRNCLPAWIDKRYSISS